jgi:hypothetical protein
MAFEDKMDQLRSSLNSNPVTNERPAPRVSKSYTLKKQDIANELSKRAKGKELTASRYLERLLKKKSLICNLGFFFFRKKVLLWEAKQMLYFFFLLVL